MLQSAAEHYQRQLRITASGLTAARKARGFPSRLLTVVTMYQRAAAMDAALAVGQMLAEQNITAPLEGRVNTAKLGGVASDGRPLDSLLEQAKDDMSFALIVATQLQDAARVAAGISIAGRPNVFGYIRMLTAPSCPRCTILAGKWFGWNSGFLRHPRCDCRHIPTSENKAGDLRTDPKLAFQSGQVTGLSRAETKALQDGADIGQVVNARRSIYMDDAGRKFTRDSTTARGSSPGPRPTPETIYKLAGDDRAAAISALQKYAYLI